MYSARELRKAQEQINAPRLQQHRMATVSFFFTARQDDVPTITQKASNRIENTMVLLVLLLLDEYER